MAFNMAGMQGRVRNEAIRPPGSGNCSGRVARLDRDRIDQHYPLRRNSFFVIHSEI